MVKRLASFIVCLGLLGISLSAQDKEWKKTLEAKLKEAYPLTKMDNALFAGRTALKNTGIVLTVQQAGIPATDGGGLMARFAIAKDGKLTNPQGRTGPGAYVCKVGDQLYVRDVNVDDDKIDIKLLTVDPIETSSKGTNTAQRYYAMVRFQFEKGFLPTADVAAIMKAIAPVLSTADQSSSAKTVELGQTFEQVEKILGKPENIAKLGPKTIYTYKNLKVIFTDGKVTDVQ
jgi:hypothetical protein